MADQYQFWRMICSSRSPLLFRVGILPGSHYNGSIHNYKMSDNYDNKALIGKYLSVNSAFQQLISRGQSSAKTSVRLQDLWFSNHHSPVQNLIALHLLKPAVLLYIVLSQKPFRCCKLFFHSFILELSFWQLMCQMLSFNCSYSWYSSDRRMLLLLYSQLAH